MSLYLSNKFLLCLIFVNFFGSSHFILNASVGGLGLDVKARVIPAGNDIWTSPVVFTKDLNNMEIIKQLFTSLSCGCKLVYFYYANKYKEKVTLSDMMDGPEVHVVQTGRKAKNYTQNQKSIN